MYRLLYLNQEIMRFDTRDEAMAFLTNMLRQPDCGYHPDDFEILDKSDDLSGGGYAPSADARSAG